MSRHHATDPSLENPLFTGPPPRSLAQRPRDQAEAAAASENTTTRSSAIASHTVPAASSTSSAASSWSRLTLEHQEEYAGDVVLEGGRPVPHGYGAVTSVAGHHCYVGAFSHGWRDGYGHLVTDRFSLWCHWRSNRPDVSHGAVRIDDADGGRYCGVAQLRLQRRAVSGAREQLSKFSQWVAQVTPCRQGWGEQVINNEGARYFGEWSEDVPHGFGCYLTSAGDRYIGLLQNTKFHGTGTLFVRGGSPGSPGLQLDGVQLRGDGAGSTSSSCLRDTPTPVEAPFTGIVLDGVWSGGRFQGEGHVTLPCGSRVTAEWLGTSHAQHGETVWTAARGVPDTRSLGPAVRWRECFHWEPLLSGARDDMRRQESARFAPLRATVHQFANSPERVKAAVTAYLQSEHSMVEYAINVFVRCFFFLHGACINGTSATASASTGSEADLAWTTRGTSARAAGGAAHRAQPQVGWCDLRQPFGGCIHGEQSRGPRTRKTQADIDLALCDLLSFTRSVQRWTLEVLGGSTSGATGTSAAAAASTVEILLACGVEQHVGRWTMDTLLVHLGGVLSYLYESVYRADESNLQASLDRLRSVVTLDDLGVEFARHEQEERLFNPYADAVRCVEQLCAEALTLTRSLELLVQVSREIDVATRLTLSEAAGSRQGKSRKAFQSGSADDLLPIHQYVLVRANAPNLYARAKLLCDVGLEPSFVDQTSQEGFCLTTLQVCVWAVAQLHPLVRDSARVLVPSTVLLESVHVAVTKSEEWVKSQRTMAAAALVDIACASDGTLAQACRGYAALWLPHLFAMLGRTGATSEALSLTHASSPEHSHFAHVPLARCPTAAGLRWICWRFAGSILALVDMELEYACSDAHWVAVESLPAQGVPAVTAENFSAERQRGFRLRILRPALPSLYTQLEAVLTSIL